MLCIITHPIPPTIFILSAFIKWYIEGVQRGSWHYRPVRLQYNCYYIMCVYTFLCFFLVCNQLNPPPPPSMQEKLRKTHKKKTLSGARAWFVRYGVHMVGSREETPHPHPYPLCRYKGLTLRFNKNRTILIFMGFYSNYRNLIKHFVSSKSVSLHLL